MRTNTKKLTLLGVLAAMSAILYLFPTFPILPAFSHLKIDFADVPALFASVAVSPIAGGAIVLIRNTIHLAATSTGMIGELSNFMISSVFVVSVGVFSRMLRANKDKFDIVKIISSLLMGAFVQVIAAMLVNYYIMIPLYGLKMPADYYIFGGVLPFNAIKDAMTGIVFVVTGFGVYPAVSRFLKFK